MPIEDVMIALGSAGQILIAAVLAVILLILLLWILVPLAVLGLRGRVGEIRDDQRRLLTAMREQQRTLNEMLGVLVEEQQVTNDLLSRLTQADQPETVQTAPPADRSPTSPAPESAPPPDGRATDRAARPYRPLVADR